MVHTMHEATNMKQGIVNKGMGMRELPDHYPLLWSSYFVLILLFSNLFFYIVYQICVQSKQAITVKKRKQGDRPYGASRYRKEKGNNTTKTNHIKIEIKLFINEGFFLIFISFNILIFFLNNFFLTFSFVWTVRENLNWNKLP
jgi:hypothetical protein